MNTDTMFDVAGKKAIVTGASRGLGQGIAEGFMEAGAEVALWSTRPVSEERAAEYRARGFAFHSLSADLADAAARERCFDQGVERLGGRIDILVNAAGIQRRHNPEAFPLSDWEAVLNTNLTAVFVLCQKAARLMIEQGGGKMINIASLMSFFGGHTIPAYTASKGGLAQLTKALANDWAAYGINVNAIAPGYMATDMNVALINDEGRRTEIIQRIPARRWGTADDMKGAALFLASAASDYVHGVILPVDGGYLGR